MENCFYCIQNEVCKLSNKLFFKLILVILENLKEFKKALLDFKTCAKNRNGRFDAFRYVMDLTFIIDACFDHFDISILQKQEIM